MKFFILIFIITQFKFLKKKNCELSEESYVHPIVHEELHPQATTSSNKNVASLKKERENIYLLGNM